MVLLAACAPTSYFVVLWALSKSPHSIGAVVAVRQPPSRSTGLNLKDRSQTETYVRVQVREFAVAVGTVLGAVVLNEPMSWYKGFGVASMTVGIALVCV
eukprot:COSAG02_NODE_9728_length_2129_cov_2.743350_2_plen_99_part_00